MTFARTAKPFVALVTDPASDPVSGNGRAPGCCAPTRIPSALATTIATGRSAGRISRMRRIRQEGLVAERECYPICNPLIRCDPDGAQRHLSKSWLESYVPAPLFVTF